MSNDPAVLFYTSDFLVGISDMEDEQVGRYIRLLCLQHQKGHLSERTMLRICRGHDDEVFSKFEQDDDGKFYNVRMEEEIVRRQNYSESRSKNRSGKTKKDKKNISKTYQKHIENVNVNVNRNVIKEENKKSYAEFVKMTATEYEELIVKFGDFAVKRMIEVLDNYKGASGKRYRSDYRAILNWVVEKVMKDPMVQEYNKKLRIAQAKKRAQDADRITGDIAKGLGTTMEEIADKFKLDKNGNKDGRDNRKTD